MTTKQPTPEGQKTRNAYSLLRFSTDRQQWGDSRQRQVELCANECARRGWTFDEKLCISDLGVSAFRGNNFDRRYALGKFLEASKKGLLLPNPTLMIENLDRFSRDLLDNADQEFWGLVKRGVDVLVLSMNGEPFTKGDENNAVKRALVIFEFDRAYKESERKSDIITKGVRRNFQLATQGVKVNLGNYIPKWVKFVGQPKQPGTFEKDPVFWDLMRKIVDAYLSGESATQIAMGLRKTKSPLFGCGKRWYSSNVTYLLRHEGLLGIVKAGKYTLKDYVPALVTKDEWEGIQSRLFLNSNRSGVKQDAKINNLFPALVFCSECGNSVEALPINANVYYRCRESKLKNLCKVSHYASLPKLELDFFSHLLTNPASIITSADDSLNVKITALQNRISDLDSRIEQISRFLKERPITEVLKQLTSLESERESAKNDLKTLRNSNHSSMAFSDNLYAVTGSFDLTAMAGMPIILVMSKEEREQQSKTLKAELSNQETRKKLSLLMPSIVSKVMIDFGKQRYQVHFSNGARTDWRKL